MNFKEIEGKDKGKIELYALSTCVWCKKTKKLLDKLKVKYSFVYVDHLDEKEKDEIREKLQKLTGRCSFPTIVINKKDYIVGFKITEINEAFN